MSDFKYQQHMERSFMVCKVTAAASKNPTTTLANN